MILSKTYITFWSVFFVLLFGFHLPESGATCPTDPFGGKVWRDYDADGILDANEIAVVEDVIIQVYDCDGQLVAADTSDANGDW